MIYNETVVEGFETIYGSDNREIGIRVEELEKNLSDEVVEFVAGNVRDVVSWINEKNFDVVMTTGASGFISAELLMAAGLPADKIIQLKKGHVRAYASEDPKPIIEELESNGINAKGLKLVVVDDYIGSGLKARQFLRALESAGLFSDIGFVGLGGPSSFHSTNFSRDEIKDRIFKDNRPGDEILKNKLFFPDRKDRNAQEFMSRTEKLASEMGYSLKKDDIGPDSDLAILDSFFDKFSDRVTTALRKRNV